MLCNWERGVAAAVGLPIVKTAGLETGRGIGRPFKCKLLNINVCENSRTIFRHESSDWTFPDTEVQIRSVVLDSSRIKINLEDSHADQY